MEGHGGRLVGRSYGGWRGAGGQAIMGDGEELVCRESEGNKTLLVCIKAWGMGGCWASGRHTEGRRVLVHWKR